MSLSWTRDYYDRNDKKSRTGKYIKQKVIAICESCSRGEKISGVVGRRYVKDNNGFCPYCRHATYSKRVPEDWDPSKGFEGKWFKRVLG